MISMLLRSKLVQHSIAYVGSGSGGGGGGSGAVRYPPYVENHHLRYLEALDVAVDGATDFLSANMVVNPTFRDDFLGYADGTGWGLSTGWQLTSLTAVGQAIHQGHPLNQSAGLIGVPYGGGEEYVVTIDLNVFTTAGLGGGSITGAPTVTGAEPFGETTINLTTGVGEAVDVKLGDTINFAGDSTDYFANSDVSIGASTTGNITIFPGLTQALAGSEVVSHTARGVGAIEVLFGGVVVTGLEAVNAIGSYTGTVIPTGAPELIVRPKASYMTKIDITYLGVYRYAASPYDDGAGGVVTSFDANAAFTYVTDSLLDVTQTRFDSLDSLITLMDPEIDWENYLATAINAIDTDVLNTVEFDDTEIDTIVDNFEVRQRTPHLKALSRLSAGFAAAGASHSSQLPVAAAMMEVGYQQVLGDFESSMRIRAAELGFSSELEYRAQKLGFLLESVRVVSSQMNARITAHAHAANLQAEVNRVAILAMTERDAADQGYVIKDATYSMDAFAYFGNLLAAPGGGISPTLGMQSSAGDAKGSALIGTIGSIASGISAGMSTYSAFAGNTGNSGAATGAVQGGGRMGGMSGISTVGVPPQAAAAVSTHGSEGQTELSASIGSKSIGGSGNIQPKYTRGATAATQFGPWGWVAAAAIMSAGTLESAGVSEQVLGVRQTEWLNEKVLGHKTLV